MIYYLIQASTKRCFGYCDYLPEPMNGLIVFGSEERIDNANDYVLDGGKLIYNPKEKAVTEQP